MLREQFAEFLDLLPGTMLLVSKDGQILAANKKAVANLRLAKPFKHLVEICTDSPEKLTSYLRLCASTNEVVLGSANFQICSSQVSSFRLEGSRVSLEGFPNAVLLQVKGSESASTAFLSLNQKIEQLACEIRQRRRIAEELLVAKTKLLDLTIELEERVEERTQSLLKANKSLESFCYSIAHDLRAPLRSIRSFTSILTTDYAHAFDEEGKALGARIQLAVARMDKLIGDLLDLGRLSHSNVDQSVVCLDEQLKNVLCMLHEETKARNAIFKVSYPLAHVRGNPTLIQQILQNLLSNALKFVEPKTVPEIEIWATTERDKVRVWVKNNGIGIEPAHHERVFGIFEKLCPKEYPGTGIGLALVKKAIERMGGEVGLQSNSGHGSVFWFELEAVQTADASN